MLPLLPRASTRIDSPSRASTVRTPTATTSARLGIHRVAEEMVGGGSNFAVVGGGCYDLPGPVVAGGDDGAEAEIGGLAVIEVNTTDSPALFG